MGKTYVRYEPEEIIAPGEILSEILDERGMTQVDLAKRMGRSEKTISQIVNGKAPITPETALQLEMVLGTTADYWINHEAQYRAFLARTKEKQGSTQWYEWLNELPIKDMKELSILSRIHNRGKNRDILLREALQFFGVNTPAEWKHVYGNLQLSYRLSKPDKSNEYARAVWLRLGELELEKMPTKRYDPIRFRDALVEIRSLTTLRPHEFDPIMRSLCTEAGVAVVMVPAVPRARISGAARWINHRPMIQLSLYGRYNDRFWFTFFHEAGHILEGERNTIFVDDDRQEDASEAEQRADRFASTILIPPNYEERLSQLRTERDIAQFATQLGIHKAIIVGRLQHDGYIEYSMFNSLKDKYEIRQ